MERCSVEDLMEVAMEQAPLTDLVRDTENRLAEVDRQIGLQQEVIEKLLATKQDTGRAIELLEDLHELQEMLQIHKDRLLAALKSKEEPSSQA
jgi:ParB-like chromosome segregation protein Spo0J